MADKVGQKIKQVVNVLVHSYRPDKIILFGSMARGNYNRNSDLDFLIIKSGVDEIDSHQRSMEVSEIIPHEISTDILVVTPYELKKRLYMGDPFYKAIISQGKVLYGA